MGARVEFKCSDFPCAPTGSLATCRCRVVSARPANTRSRGFRLGLAFEEVETAFVQNLLQWGEQQVLVQKKTEPRHTFHNQQWF